VLPIRQVRRLPPHTRNKVVLWDDADDQTQQNLSKVRVVRHAVQDVRWVEGEGLREENCWCRPFNVFDARMPLQVFFEDSGCELHESVGVTDLYLLVDQTLWHVPIYLRVIKELVVSNLDQKALSVVDVSLHSVTAAAIGCYISALRANGFKSNGTSEVLKRGEQFLKAMTRHQIEMEQHLSGPKATPRVK
jgi:hypothetical protein